MKKKKILVLFPVLGLLLSGCTFQEGLANAKSWVSQHIYHPIKDWISGGGNKEEPSDGGGQQEEKTLQEIVSVSAPASIKKGETLAPSSVDLVVKYSDKSTEAVKAESVDLDTSTVGDAVQGTAHYKALSKTFTIKVYEEGGGEGEKPEHAGTEADPFTGADAVIVANGLEQGGVTTEYYYIKGKVTALKEAYSAEHGNYSFEIEGGFIGWRLKNGSSFAKFNEGDIAVDDVVTMYVQIQLYGDDKLAESKNGYVVKVEKPASGDVLTSIEIGGTPQTSYVEGASYNHNGLTVTAHYEGAADKDVTNGADWSISKEKAAVGDELITITASYTDGEITKTATKDVEVTVTAKGQTEHAGTEADPFTAADAITTASSLSPGQMTEEEYYIKGEVKEFYETFSTQYGSYSFKIENDFKGHRLKNGPDKTAYTTGKEIEVGDTVTMKGKIKNYNGDIEVDGTLSGGAYVVKVDKAPEKTMTGLVADSAVGIPETVYVDGKLDKNNITVVAKYDDNSEAAVHPDSIDLDTSVAKDNVKGKLVVGEFEYEFTINVIEKVIPVGLVADKLDRAFTGVESTSYTAWSDKAGESGAVYAGQSAGGNDAIQLRTNNNNSGIITTTSGGILKKVEVEWNENTAADRDVEVYGKNSAYESPEDLYNSEKRGTLLATIHNGTTEVDIEGEFEYIGIKSKNSALYLDSITFYYQPATPAVAVSSVSIEPKELEMYVGDDAQPLFATVLPEDATDKVVTWSASPEGVVSVEDGAVTALKAGTATITASAGGVDSAEPCVVTVKQHVTGVTITPTLNLVAGNKGSVVVVVAPEDATVDTFTLVSDHPEIASVEQNGEVTAVAEGTAEITVTTTDGSLTAKCTVTVSALEIPVVGVVIEDEAPEVSVGGALVLDGHVNPENATQSHDLVWSVVSGEEYASVNQEGQVTGLAVGEAVVRATSVVNEEFHDEVTVQVTKVAVEEVELDQPTLSLSVGGSGQLAATVSPNNATYKTVSWTSSNDDVATVSASGLVTATGVGTAVITASADGQSATCTVTVANAPGTQQNPYTVDELLTAYGNLGENEWSESRVYVTGEVIAISNAPEYTLRGTNGNLAVYKPTSALGEEDVLPCVGDVAVFEGFVERYVYSTTDKIELTGYAKDTVEAHQVFPTIQSVVSRGTSEISLDANSSQNATVTFEGTATNASEYSFTVLIAEGYELTAVTVNGNALEGEDGVYSFIVKGNSVIKVTTHEAGQEVPDPWDYTFEAKKWDKAGEQTLDGHVWTMSGTGGAYFGYDGTKGQQFGSSSASFSALTLSCSDFSGTIASIDVYTSGASKIAGDVQVSVGGTSFGAAQALSATNTKYTFSLEEGATGEVQISWSQTSSKAFYVKQIVVTFK